MTTIPAPTPAPATAGIATRTKIEIVAGILLLIAMVIVGRAWLAEHRARLKADATVATAQKSLDQAAASAKQLQAADQQRNAQSAAAIAKLASAAAAQKTPRQIAKWIPQQMEKFAIERRTPLPAPIESSIAPATPQNPTPPAIVAVPQADLPGVRDSIARCQENAVALPNAQQGLSSCQTQLKLAGEELSAAEAQRDAYKQELQGGTLWHRLKGGAKKVLIGAAIGAAAVCASGHCK